MIGTSAMENTPAPQRASAMVARTVTKTWRKSNKSSWVKKRFEECGKVENTTMDHQVPPDRLTHQSPRTPLRRTPPPSVDPACMPLRRTTSQPPTAAISRSSSRSSERGRRSSKRSQNSGRRSNFSCISRRICADQPRIPYEPRAVSGAPREFPLGPA